MANRRPRLAEVDFIFLHGTGQLRRNRLTIHASLHEAKLYLSFSIGGPAESRETLPAVLVDTIRAGLDYAAKHVRVQDLAEEDGVIGDDSGDL